MQKIILGFILLAASSLVAPSIAADSPCKGLENASCTKLDGCTWRKGYKTKKGTAVRAHCRKGATPKPKV